MRVHTDVQSLQIINDINFVTVHLGLLLLSSELMTISAGKKQVKEKTMGRI